MSHLIFEQNNYKGYLKDRLAGKGSKGAFSRAVGCQSSFLSQVLGGKPDLSLEQGALANDFFGHNEAEARHFILLLQLGRASSKRLREYFQAEINQSLGERQKISKRILSNGQVGEADRATYYSSWTYGAVHVLTSIESSDQMSFLADKSGMKTEELLRVLDFLVQAELVVFADGKYRPTKNRIHMPHSSPTVLNHHRNARLRAMEEMKLAGEKSLNFSMLMAISQADGAKIREMILGFIESTDRVVSASPEERAFQLNLDFFEV